MAQPRFISKQTAGRIAVCFFAGLGFFNLLFTGACSRVHLPDYGILLLTALPALVQYKGFHIFYGIVSAFISLYMGAACLVFSFHPAVRTTSVDFAMGGIFIMSCAFASGLLIYSALGRRKGGLV